MDKRIRMDDVETGSEITPEMRARVLETMTVDEIPTRLLAELDRRRAKRDYERAFNKFARNHDGGNNDKYIFHQLLIMERTIFKGAVPNMTPIDPRPDETHGARDEAVQLAWQAHDAASQQIWDQAKTLARQAVHRISALKPVQDQIRAFNMTHRTFLKRDEEEPRVFFPDEF